MLRRVLIWIGVRFAAGLILLSLVLVWPLRYVEPPGSSFMLLHKARVAGARIDHQWVPRDAISRHMALAAVAAEDQRFYEHRGFDFAGIRAAIAEGGVSGPNRGASTITQQTVKNLYLWPGRSWIRKGIEAWLTIWVELLLPKDRILEIYLNIAQFGPATYGVEAASRSYFANSAAALDPEQAALLAAVLPGPVLYRAANPSPFVLERQNWVQLQATRLDTHVDVSAFGP